ncbi:MAG: 16S rRNA (cytosine(1402)-N(4))-methyltransferase RsmH [Bacteroides sp.]|nr:16S rRNA (cytosine(1402)-N(4))-methyltransferase RsmH [Bacillota bacterium]MCM1394344.1 16S rRNA (cytosine(1402)-N(4))-methyltransferase RsmH [[Eubacterium] siraeum]MCM1455036.1 16S rRNA (cytosine(1402)-N(4))-methyltransferase RsmH [Bacteroides sp.]
MEFHHVPVMLAECIEELNVKADGIYVDCTVGGAGHSCEIAKRLNSDGRLIAVDKDADALMVAGERLKEYGKQVTFLHDDFKNLTQDLDVLNIESVDGILIDLGVSSYQLDNAERGFSYMKDAPLDMRMDRSQYLSAFNVVNEFSAGEIIKILYDYGEEKLAKRIAENIIRVRSKQTIETTLQLAKIVENSYPAATRYKYGHPAKRTFQAIRIAVNDELSALKESVKQMAMRLKSGGRMAVITFHSLEDRIIKTAFKELSADCTCPSDFPICVCGNKKTVELVNKKPILPSDEELKNNSRSQSAKLRIIEKI